MWKRLKNAMKAKAGFEDAGKKASLAAAVTFMSIAEKPKGPVTLQRRASAESLNALRSLYGTGGTLVRGSGLDEPAETYEPGAAEESGRPALDEGDEEGGESQHSARPALFAADQTILEPSVFGNDEEVARAKTAAVRRVQAAVEKARASLQAAPEGSWPAEVLPPRVESRYEDTRAGDVPFESDPDSADALKIANKYGLRDAILAAANVLQFDLDALAVTLWAALGDFRTTGEDEEEDWSDWANQVALHEVTTKKARRGSWNAERDLSGGELLGQNVLEAVRNIKAGPAVHALAMLTHQLSSAVYADVPEGEETGIKIFNLNTARGGKPVQDHLMSVAAIFRGHNSSFNDRNELPMSSWTPEMKQEILGAIAMIESGTAPDMTPSDVRRIRSAVREQGIAPIAYLQAVALTRDHAFHDAAKITIAPYNATYYSAPVRSFDDIGFDCGVGGKYFSMDTSTAPFSQQCTNPISADIHFNTKGDLHRAYMALVDKFGQPVTCVDQRDDPQHNVEIVFRFMELLVQVTLSFHATTKITPLSKVARAILALQVEESVVSSGLDKVFDFYGFDSATDIQCAFPL